jgi:Putative zinc- or iron-chelating domain
MTVAERLVGCTRQDFIAACWRGNAGPIPCGDCSACCYYAGIPVDEKRDRKRLPHLLTERNSDGELVPQRRADGGCIHLGERGCMVYQHRPAVCRSFDCRAFAAMGLVEHCASNLTTPDWNLPRASDEQTRPILRPACHPLAS